MSLLRFPEPYDFELSTGPLPRVRHRPREPARRQRALPSRGRPRGADHGAARRRRRRAARRRDAAGRRAAARSRRSTCRRSTRGRRARTRCSRRSSSGCAASGRRSRPTRSSRSSRRSRRSRSRSSRRSRSATGSSSGSALRSARRGRSRRASASHSGARGRALRRRLLAPEGGVRGRPRAQRPRPRRARALDDDEVRARITALRGLGPVDGRVVPRAPPRTAARLAGRRPRAPQGGRRSLRCRGARARPTPRPVPEPVRALPPHRMADATMTIRRATEADEAILRELWEEFEPEVPEPGLRRRDLGREWRTRSDDIARAASSSRRTTRGPLGVARIEKPERGARTSSSCTCAARPPPGRDEGAACANARATHGSRARPSISPRRPLLERAGIASCGAASASRSVSKFMATPLDALDARLAET